MLKEMVLSKKLSYFSCMKTQYHCTEILDKFLHLAQGWHSGFGRSQEIIKRSCRSSNVDAWFFQRNQKTLEGGNLFGVLVTGKLYSYMSAAVMCVDACSRRLNRQMGKIRNLLMRSLHNDSRKMHWKKQLEVYVGFTVNNSSFLFTTHSLLTL